MTLTLHICRSDFHSHLPDPVGQLFSSPFLLFPRLLGPHIPLAPHLACRVSFVDVWFVPLHRDLCAEGPELPLRPCCCLLEGYHLEQNPFSFAPLLSMMYRAVHGWLLLSFGLVPSHVSPLFPREGPTAQPLEGSPHAGMRWLCHLIWAHGDLPGPEVPRASSRLVLPFECRAVWRPPWLPTWPTDRHFQLSKSGWASRLSSPRALPHPPKWRLSSCSFAVLR